jgi:selenocysteine-specific elongation factor
VLSKVDMTPDLEWLDLVESDVRQAVDGTVLAEAPLVRVSAKTGEGIAQVTAALSACLADRPQRVDHGRPRLPIDRVFTIPGFGTVVTGTLIDGRLKLGEEVEILPSGMHGRIRGLQSHKRKEQSAVPGSRTAVNITGVEVEQVQRGEVLSMSGKYRPTRLIDVHFRLLPDAAGPVRHSTEVKFFLGTAEILARVRLLGAEELKPGQEGWLQLELRDPTIAVRGDRYILRRPSPGETLGGGTVLDPHPKGRHRRFAEAVLARLESLRRGSPADVLAQVLQLAGPLPLREAVTRARLTDEQARAAVSELVENGLLSLLEQGDPTPGSELLVWVQSQWLDQTERAVREVEHHHQNYPLRRGMQREELKSRLKIAAPRVFTAYMRRWTAENVLAEEGSLVWRVGHQVAFKPQQKALVDRLLAKFAQSPFSPPTVKDAQAEVGEDVFQAMLELGYLVPVSSDVVFRKQDYDQMVVMVRLHFESQESLTAAQFRDQLNTSRRYVLAFLEHLDSAGMTVREGDARRLRKTGSNR